jgi:hypothetical protein
MLIHSVEVLVPQVVADPGWSFNSKLALLVHSFQAKAVHCVLRGLLHCDELGGAAVLEEAKDTSLPGLQ